MDSYETMNACGSNFDSKSKFGSLGGLTRDEKQSMKSLKYYTQNFYDKNIILNRGINFNDGFGVPGCNIDKSTTYRNSQLTNAKCIQELPPFPMATTANFSKGQGNTLIEDSLRPQNIRVHNSCQPRETNYYNRSFTIFDNLPIKPNGCVDNVVQSSYGYYMGEPTRKPLSKNYINGKYCNIKKY